MENLSVIRSRDITNNSSSKKANAAKVNADQLRKNLQIKAKTREQIKEILSKDNPNFDIDKLLEEISKYNHQLTIFDKGIKLRVNNNIDRVVITVVNNKTNRVIMEYPYKQIQKLVEHLKKMTGVLIDKEV